MGQYWLLEGRGWRGRHGRDGGRVRSDNVSSVLLAAQRWCGNAHTHTFALCTHSPFFPTSIPWLHVLQSPPPPLPPPPLSHHSLCNLSEQTLAGFQSRSDQCAFKTSIFVLAHKHSHDCNEPWHNTHKGVFVGFTDGKTENTPNMI